MYQVKYTGLKNRVIEETGEKYINEVRSAGYQTNGF